MSLTTIETAPTRIVREPSVRTYMLWSVSRLRMAERMADTGNLRYAAEFCDALFGDDRISAVLQTRVMALLGLPISFEASGDGRRRGRATRALETEEDWWTMAPIAALSLVMKWGLTLGVGPANLPWSTKDGRDVPVIHPWHGAHLSYDQSLQEWRIATDKVIEVVAGADAIPTNGRWALYTPFGAHRPWSHGMWRGMSRWYLLKQYAIDDWGRHSETASMRVAEFERGEHSEGSTKEARQELANDLYEASRDASIVMPDGFHLKLVEATANTRDIYEAQVNAANLAFAIQALGHNLTTEVSGQGSFAAGKVGESVRLDYKRFDNESVGTFAHDQLIVPWSAVNFGDPALALWPWWKVEPPRDKKADAQTLTEVAKAVSVFTQAAAPVDVRKVLEGFEVPLLPEGQTLTPVVTTAPAPQTRDREREQDEEAA